MIRTCSEASAGYWAGVLDLAAVGLKAESLQGLKPDHTSAGVSVEYYLAG